MRNTLLIGLLLTAISSMAHAETPVSMRLVRGIDATYPGDVMILQEAKQNGCRFYGKLMHKPLPSEKQNKIVAFIFGDVGEWWIDVSMQQCMTGGTVLERAVKYRVDLDPLKQHPAGEYVTAISVQ